MVELINFNVKIGVRMKIEGRKWSPVSIIMGVLVLVAGLTLGPFTLANIFLILLGIYSISLEILKKDHEDSIAIIMGISLLTGTLIWTTLDNTFITDFSNLVYLITALLFITCGILGWLGLVPGWFRSLGR